MASAKDLQSGGSPIGPNGSVVSKTTTSGAVSGDQSAGLVRGSASGAVGKTQPPPPGQTLLFRLFDPGVLGDARRGLGKVLPVFRITLQELLRKIRVVVMPILIGGR